MYFFPSWKHEENKSSTEESRKYPVVAAIDFGTTFTGYALEIKGRDGIITATKGNIWSKERVPTCVLLNSDRSFNSFGYDAEDKYHEIPTDKRGDFYFFKSFKMELYRSRKLSRNFALLDDRRRPVNALIIFSMVIKYLKGLVYKSLRMAVCDSGSGMPQIQWMLSVPAVWSDSARQFMREAAMNARIPEDDLRLVLEPEAASLFCRKKLIDITGAPCVGHKYILADLGGGTVDICAHELMEGGKIQELFCATGDDCGGTQVDYAFHQFMIRLVGAPTWTDFKENHTKKYIKLLRDFEEEKRRFDIGRNVRLELGYNLIKIYKKHSVNLGDTLEEAIPNTPFAQDVIYDPDQCDLTIKSKQMAKFFEPSVERTIDKLKEVFKACLKDDIQTVLAVGGYAESRYVRNRIRNELEEFGIKIVLELDPRLAVLQGAVLMGSQPKNVIQRRACFTYGFRATRHFNSGVHPENLKILIDGREYCNSIFVKLIEKGQTVKYGQMFKYESNTLRSTAEAKHKNLTVELFKSSRDDPQYCTEDEGCSIIGKITMTPPSEGWPDILRGEDQLIVGETEFFVKAVNKQSGEEYEASVDFL